MSVVLAALNPQRSEDFCRREMENRRRGWRWMSRERQPVSLEQMDSTHLFNSMRYLYRKARNENRSMFNRSARGIRPLDRRAWSFLVMFDEILRRCDLSQSQVRPLIDLLQTVLGGEYLTNLGAQRIPPDMISAENRNSPFLQSFQQQMENLTRRDEITYPPVHQNSRSVVSRPRLPTDILDQMSNQGLRIETEVMERMAEATTREQERQLMSMLGYSSLREMMTQIQIMVDTFDFGGLMNFVTLAASAGIERTSQYTSLEQSIYASDHQEIQTSFTQWRRLLVDRQESPAVRGLARAFAAAGQSTNDAADALRYAMQGIGNLGAPVLSGINFDQVIMDDPIVEEKVKEDIKSLTQIGRRKIIIEENE